MGFNCLQRLLAKFPNRPAESFHMNIVRVQNWIYLFAGSVFCVSVLMTVCVQMNKYLAVCVQVFSTSPEIEVIITISLRQNTYLGSLQCFHSLSQLARDGSRLKTCILKGSLPTHCPYCIDTVLSKLKLAVHHGLLPPNNLINFIIIIPRKQT